MSMGSSDKSDDFHIGLVKDFLIKHQQPTVQLINDYVPENHAYEWREFVMESWEYKLDIFKRAGNSNIDGFERVPIKDVGAKHIANPIELDTVVVIGISQNEVQPIHTRMKCMHCMQEAVFPPNHEIAAKDRFCGCGFEKIVHMEDPRDFVDIQWVRLQEPRRDSKISKIPISVPALLTGQFEMWSLQFNQRVRPMGLLRYRITKDKISGGKRRQAWFQIYGVKKVSEDEEYNITLTEQDIEYIKSEMEKEGFFDKLLKSFCPFISGMEVVKEVSLLTLASVGLKVPARALVIGDPSTGKSAIGNYSANLLPGSYYIVMANARKTGLTATSQKNPDSDTWMVEPGAFAAADGRAIFIDEFQQGQEDDIKALNYVIEHGKIPYALAGGNVGDFDANCALVIFCNAHSGMIGTEKNIHEILKFVGKGLAAFVSRMNIILVIKDDTTYSDEELIANQMYDNSALDPAAKYQDDWSDAEGHTFYGTKTIRKIIKYVIEYVKLQGMPKEIQKMFVENYMRKWNDPVERVNKLINRRFLRHSIVLAQYYARLQGRSMPTESDALHIFELLEKHMSFAAFDPKTQEIDAGMLNGMQSRREQKSMDDQSEIREAIDKYMSEKDPDGIKIHKFFTVEGICEKLWYSDPIKWNDAEPKIRKIIDGFLKHRLIYEKGAEHSGEYDTSW